ncbi:DNA methyltransferase, partial [Escherichia coli]
NRQIINDPNAYLEYDNYDAIEVPKTNGIPSDYDGVMGVPISFLDKYCPEQFEIICMDFEMEGLHQNLIKSDWNDKFDRGYLKGKRMHSRIFIKHIKPQNK